MLKGVNKQIIEVTDTGNNYISKAILFVNPDKTGHDRDFLIYQAKKYLEQIVPLLSKAGMLRSNRGYQGGYRLTKTPAEYTVGDVLRVTEGDLACVSCVLPGNNDCPREAECITKPVWDGLYQTVTTYLDSITLQDILDQQRERYANDYVI